MLIRKVKIFNFRQYYKENVFDFSCDPERNVTIIRGENGVGKTALLNAIKWAFFSTFTNNFRNSKDLINSTASRDGSTTCSVQIEFEEDGREFLLIRRHEEGVRSSKVKVYEYIDSVLSPALPEPELVINSMLPKEMGEYFFFQGEGSNAVDTGNNSGNLAQSIRDIMGFKVAENLKESLRKMINSASRDAAAQDKSGESSKINDNILANKKRLESAKNGLRAVVDRIPVLDGEIERVEEDLSRINNTSLHQLRSEEREKDAQLRKLKTKLKELESKKYKSISKFGWAVFGHDFANVSQDFIDESELKGKLPEPYNKTFIEDILEQKECICGSCLEVGSDSFKKITSMLERAANPMLLQRLTGIRAQVQDINTLYSIADDDMRDLISQAEEVATEVERTKLALQNLNEKICQIPEDAIKKLQTSKRKLSDDLKSQIRAQVNYESSIDRIEKEIKSESKRLSEISNSSQIVAALSYKQAFLEVIQEYLSDYLGNTEKNVRLHVLAEVNKTLSLFSRHDFKIKVSENDFRFFLLDKNDSPVGQGDGLNLLLNLTITSALIHFASERKKVKDPILNSATVAPLVIDAPFGVLDTKYRNVVIKLLPNYARQVVFLVSSSQWTDEMDTEVRDRIGKEYVLVLEESASQGSKEVDKIKVQGHEYIASRYSCDIDRTVIQEIGL